MAHVGQEFTFGPAVAFGLFLGQPHLLAGVDQLDIDRSQLPRQQDTDPHHQQHYAGPQSHLNIFVQFPPVGQVLLQQAQTVVTFVVEPVGVFIQADKQ